MIKIDVKEHCIICKTTFAKVPKWADHAKTIKHKTARAKLLHKFKSSSDKNKRKNSVRKRKRPESTQRIRNQKKMKWKMYQRSKKQKIILK